MRGYVFYLSEGEGGDGYLSSVFFRISIFLKLYYRLIML